MRHGTAYLAVLLMGAGFAAIGLAWNGAAEQDCIQCQFPYLISGGIGGLGLIVAGAALAIVHQIRLSGRSRTDSSARTAADLPGKAPAAPRPGAGDTPRSAPDGTVMATRSTYHLPGCEVVSGDPTRTMTPAAASEQGLRPCHLCNPPARSA